MIGNGPLNPVLHQQGEHVLAHGLFGAPHTAWTSTEDLLVLEQGPLDLFASILRVGESPTGQHRFTRTDPGSVAIG